MTKPRQRSKQPRRRKPLLTPPLRKGIREFLTQLPLLHAQAFRLKLYKTGHALHAAVQASGYEAADLEQRDARQRAGMYGDREYPAHLIQKMVRHLGLYPHNKYANRHDVGERIEIHRVCTRLGIDMYDLEKKARAFSRARRRLG